MKRYFCFKSALVCIFLFTTPLTNAQNTKQDSLKSITTIGIFDGKKIRIGNFESEEVYKINEFCIYPANISEKLLDSLKGKKIMISGKFKITEGKTMSAKTNKDGKICEPYKEPDKKFIIDPIFTIVYDTREPLIKKE